MERGNECDDDEGTAVRACESETGNGPASDECVGAVGNGTDERSQFEDEESSKESPLDAKGAVEFTEQWLEGRRRHEVGARIEADVLE